MKTSIPTTLGLLGLSVAAAGCSDATKLANTLEKVCKEECECPDSMDDWNDVSNCKKSCEGYAIQFEAYVADQVDTEPCAEFDSILKDMKRCTKNSCGDSRDNCLNEIGNKLYECWDLFGGGYYYYYGGQSVDPTVTASDIYEQLMHPIPGALEAEDLHSAG